jgi:serine/threonine protein kinase/Tfp pilus assembly protein PilF
MSHDEPSAQRLTGSVLAALWPQDAPDDVRALLDGDSRLRGDKDAVLDLAFDEYCRLAEAGEAPDPEEYCARFPTFGQSLLRAILAQEYLAANPSLLEDKGAVAWPGPGETFLGFRLLRELGRGAFARVFLAAEPDLGDRLVAVKISPHGGSEAQTLGPLNHPNVVKVHAVRKDERSGLTAVCMPYLGGATLSGVVASFQNGRPRRARVILDAARAALGPDLAGDRPAPNPLLQTAPYAEGVCFLGLQLAEALAFLHGRGIFHRDLKPSNVLLCPDGRPMLLDFNLSADPNAARQRLGGTLPYMSPEQVRAIFRLDGPTAPVDGRSDLFGLGVILFELLTGRQPFGPVPPGIPEKDDAAALLDGQQEGAPPVRRLCPEVTPGLARVIDRCLRPNRDRRPADAAEVAAALRRDLAWHRRAVRRLRRHPRKLAAAAVLALALAAGGAGYLAVRPPYAERMLNEAKVAYAAGDNDTALERAGRVLKAAPDSDSGYLLRARAYQRRGDLGLAQNDYAAAERLGAGGQAAAGLGYLLTLDRKHPNAIDAYRRAIRDGFGTAEVYNDLAYSQIKLGKYREADDNLRQALRLVPNLPAANHNRLCLVKYDLLNSKRRLPEVADLLTRAINGAPESAELYQDAADVCATAGKPLPGAKPVPACDDAALTYLARAVDLGLVLPAEKPTDKQYARLWTDARLVALRHVEPKSAGDQPTRRLVDPLRDQAPTP